MPSSLIPFGAISPQVMSSGLQLPGSNRVTELPRPSFNELDTPTFNEPEVRTTSLGGTALSASLCRLTSVTGDVFSYIRTNEKGSK